MPAPYMGRIFLLFFLRISKGLSSITSEKQLRFFSLNFSPSMALYFSAFCHLLLYIWAKFGLTFSPFFRRFYGPWRPNFPFSRPPFQWKNLLYIDRRSKSASPIYGANFSFFPKDFKWPVIAHFNEFSRHLWPSISLRFAIYLFILGPDLASHFRHFQVFQSLWPRIPFRSAPVLIDFHGKKFPIYR